MVRYTSLMLVIFPKDVLENNELNLNNEKTKRVFRYKDQGFQIKQTWMLLLFPLTKRKRVVNF